MGGMVKSILRMIQTGIGYFLIFLLYFIVSGASEGKILKMNMNFQQISLLQI